MRGAYSVLGLRLDSEVPLPDLPAWDGGARSPDLAVRLARGGLPDLTFVPGPEADVAADGWARVGAAGVGTFVVRDGSEVLVDPLVPPTAPLLQPYLLGSVLALACHQRGLLPLHAGAIACPRGVILLVGDSGAGKSTLSAALLARGLGVVAEDLAPLAWPEESAAPLALPSVPRLKLLPAVLRRYGHDPDGLPELPRSGGKRALLVPRAPAGQVIAVCHLRIAGPGQGPGLEPLPGVAALASLQRNVLHWPTALAMGRGPETFRRLALLARQVPHWRLRRTEGLGRLEETASLVHGLAGGGA